MKKYNQRFTKFRKNRIKGNEYRKTKLHFGTLGIKSLENARLTTKQLETFMFTLKKYTKNYGKVWQRLYPTISVTNKPREVRMGKGKGAINCWIAPVRKGQILYEVLPFNNQNDQQIFFALKTVIQKLPVAVTIIKY